MAKSKSRRQRMKLTDQQWDRVFQSRCRSKQGQVISEDDCALLVAAFNEDPERYNALGSSVFEATAPFGSNVPSKKRT